MVAQRQMIVPWLLSSSSRSHDTILICIAFASLLYRVCIMGATPWQERLSHGQLGLGNERSGTFYLTLSKYPARVGEVFTLEQRHLTSGRAGRNEEPQHRGPAGT